MKLFVAAVVIGCTAALLVSPATAGAGGQAVKKANQWLKEEGTNLGQAIKAARETGDLKIGPLVSDCNEADCEWSPPKN